MKSILNRVLLAIVVWLGLCAGMATGQDTQEVVVPLSDPAAPVILEVNLMRGSLKVMASDREQVVVEVAPRIAEDEPERVDGMLKIPNRSVGLDIKEKNNRVEIHSEWSGPPLDLVIYTPRLTSANLSSGESGDLEVEGLSGEHELRNLEGSILARSMRGSVVASTTDGSVIVELLEVAPGKAMSFATWTGEVDVTFPLAFKADLKMKAGQGDILSDFEVELVPTEAKVERGGERGGFELKLDREVYARVGGGGPEIHLRTAMGSIFLRKPKTP